MQFLIWALRAMEFLGFSELARGCNLFSKAAMLKTEIGDVYKRKLKWKGAHRNRSLLFWSDRQDYFLQLEYGAKS